MEGKKEKEREREGDLFVNKFTIVFLKVFLYSGLPDASRNPRRVYLRGPPGERLRH